MRAAKRDANEGAIVAALQTAGALVLRLDAFDLLVWHRGRLSMLDAKTPHGRATRAQERLRQVGWPLHYVRDPIEALRAIGALR